MPRAFGSPLWRNGAFVRVCTAATISIFGSLITRMALPFVAILVLHAGPLEVSLLRSLDVLAALLFGLVAGVWSTAFGGARPFARCGSAPWRAPPEMAEPERVTPERPIGG